MKLLGYGVSIVCVIIGLLRAHDTTEPPYMMADELSWNMARYQNKTVRVHGWVVPGSIHTWAENHTTFTIVKNHVKVGVDFAGIVPDTFKDGTELVVRGRVEHDVVEATELMAKCGGKYETPPVRVTYFE